MTARGRLLGEMKGPCLYRDKGWVYSGVQACGPRSSESAQGPHGTAYRTSEAGRKKATVHILYWIIVGLIAGILAKAVVPGKEGGGWIGSILLGLVGSLLGGFLFRTLLGESFGGWIGSIVVAFVGAVVALLLFNLVTRRGAAR